MMKLQPSHSRVLSVVLGLGLGLVASFVLQIRSPLASANSCTVLGHGVGAASGGGLQEGYGDRSMDPGVAVRDTQVLCRRISSLVVADSSNSASWVEVGWFDNCGDDSQCASNFQNDCDQVSHPHILVYRAINGTPTCKSGTDRIDPTQAPNDGMVFKVTNPNHDNTWEYYAGGDSQGSYFVGFSKGLIQTQVGERHNSADSAWGHQQGLQYQGGGGGWHDWSNTEGSSDVQPDYYYCHISDTDLASKQVC
jgi:hypothetical protein